MKQLLAALLISGLATVACAADKDAVVIIGNCSGVCVHPAGLILSAKHCGFDETEMVTFSDRQVKAKRVYVSPDGDGPVVFDCEGDGFPWLPVAQAVPAANSPVTSLGWPVLNEKRQFRQARGRLLRGGQFHFQGKAFMGNVVSFPTWGGWSGGPLLNAQGEVIGLLSASDNFTSVFISFAATRKAYDTVRPPVPPEPVPVPTLESVQPLQPQPLQPQPKPRLLVFTIPGCLGCVRFKQDFDRDADFRQELKQRFEVSFVDVGQQPEVARKYGVTVVPTFVRPGRKPLIGYEGTSQLLKSLTREKAGTDQ